MDHPPSPTEPHTPVLASHAQIALRRWWHPLGNLHPAAVVGVLLDLPALHYGRTASTARHLLRPALPAFPVQQPADVQAHKSAWCAPQDIIDGLHSRGQRFVPIVEPVVHVKQGYATYDSGIAEDVFVKDVRGDPYLGQVAPSAACLLTVHVPCFLLACQGLDGVMNWEALAGASGGRSKGYRCSALRPGAERAACKEPVRGSAEGWSRLGSGGCGMHRGQSQQHAAAAGARFKGCEAANAVFHVEGAPAVLIVVSSMWS